MTRGSVALNKSRFHVSEVDYLGFIISEKGIALSPSKTEEIQVWKPPKPDATPHQLEKWAQEFIGFSNFYRKFIDSFSKITVSITDLTKKNRRRQWTPQCQEAFEHLKRQFCEAPILAHFLSDQRSEEHTSELQSLP